MKFERPPIDPEKKKVSQYELFASACGATAEDIAKAKEILDVGPLPKSPLEAARELRFRLIKSNVGYDTEAYSLQHIARKNKGNCLSLTLLVGAELESKGYEVGYDVLINPHDLAYTEEVKFFEKIKRGEEVLRADNPHLTMKQFSDPYYSFMWRMHPVPVLEGKKVEMTTLTLDEHEYDLIHEADIPAEASWRVNYGELISNVFLAQAKEVKKQNTLEKKITLNEKSIERWPRNREAWSNLYQLAEQRGDAVLMQHAKATYDAIGGTDAVFAYNQFLMTHDVHWLDQVLEQHPSFLLAFVEREVNMLLQKGNTVDAKYNFAVANRCASESMDFTIKDFCEMYWDLGEKLYGKDFLKMAKLNNARKNNKPSSDQVHIT